MIELVENRSRYSTDDLKTLLSWLSEQDPKENRRVYVEEARASALETARYQDLLEDGCYSWLSVELRDRSQLGNNQCLLRVLEPKDVVSADRLGPLVALAAQITGVIPSNLAFGLVRGLFYTKGSGGRFLVNQKQMWMLQGRWRDNHNIVLPQGVGFASSKPKSTELSPFALAVAQGESTYREIRYTIDSAMRRIEAQFLDYAKHRDHVAKGIQRGLPLTERSFFPEIIPERIRVAICTLRNKKGYCISGRPAEDSKNTLFLLGLDLCQGPVLGVRIWIDGRNEMYIPAFLERKPFHQWEISWYLPLDGLIPPEML